MNYFKNSILSALFILLNFSILAQTIQIGTQDNYESISSIDEHGFIVKLRINELDLQKIKTESGVFQQININGFGKSLDYGNPQLPVYKRLMELPEGANYEVVILLKKTKLINLAEYGISDFLIPAQLPVPKIENPQIDFQYQKQTYQSNSFYRNDLVKIIPLGKMRASSIARLEISPIAYNPKSNTLEVIEELEVQILISNVNQKTLNIEKQKYYSPYFQTLNNRLINGEAYSGAKIITTVNSFPLKYVIVADSMFKQSLQPFVRWKEKKGFKVIEAYQQNPAVGSTTTSIKSYLQGLYNSASIDDPAPTYVLFVGDIAQMPAWTGVASSALRTDLYYCEFTNDEFPEMMYGRFSANDTSELNPQINKTIEYETYTMPDPSFLGKSVLIAGHDASHGSTWGDGQINYGTNNYFNSSNSTSCTSFLYVNGSYNKDLEIRQTIDSGASIANYTAHGSELGWADPTFNVSHVASMTNEGKYPLMIGNACLTNKFITPVCFGEALLRAKNKGAIGYLGASENTYWDEDFYWAVGLGTVSANPTYNGTGSGLYDKIFHTHNEAFTDWAMSSSQYIQAGNLAVTQSGSSSRLYWELYHVMGDPSLMAYTKIPDPITVSFVPFIPFGWANYTLTTVPYAQVALSVNDTLISSAIADSMGFADLELGVFNIVGTIDLVITAQNYAPFTASLFGGSPIGPYVVSTQTTIDDAAGNNNGLADQAEIVKLNVEFANLTQYLAGSSVAKFVSTDNQITILDSTFNLGAIAGFDTLTFDTIFTLSTAPNAEDQHIVHGNIVITDTSGGTWSTPMHFSLHAPNIQIMQCVVDDAITGNNNGIIEAGETVKIRILLQNTGSNDASNVVCNYVSQNSLAVVTSNYLINTLSANQSAWAEFTVQFDAQFNNGDFVKFIFDYVSQAYSGSKDFPQLVGQVDEDFESGDYSKFIWESINNLNWNIDSSTKYEGAYSSRSASTITDNDTSSMYVTMNVLTNDSIVFYRQTSTEIGYDYLMFYIDDVLQEKWSGNKSWEKFSFGVTAGMHTFKWAYIKDYYMAEGQDAAWVDYINFPPTDAWSSIEEQKEAQISQIKLWPNPASDQVQIELELLKSGIIYTTIFNQLGQETAPTINHGKQAVGFNHLQLDASHLAAGIYFVQIRINDQQYFQKLIIQ